MSRMLFKKVISLALIAAMLGGTGILNSITAFAAGHVLPENEGDIGVYTNGQTHVTAIGFPTYNYTSEVAAKLAPGVAYTADSMYESIFEKDLAAGGTDYYLDRVMGVSGNIGGSVLQTRGRSLYMRGNSSLGTMGFAGSAYAGGPNNLGNFYTITVEGQSVSEVASNRFNAPSHFKSRYNIGGTGVTADLKKFITYDNVAGTVLTLNNPTASDVTLKLIAAAPLAKTGVEGAEDELIGTRVLTSGSNNGTIDTPWATVTIGLKAEGFTAAGGQLERTVSISAGESMDVSVMGVLYGEGMPDSPVRFNEYAAYEPMEAFRIAVTDFNRRWASDVPYINVPSPAIEKAIIYRWWGERYNSLDTNTPGHVYQYPVTIEGVNLYQNAIVLTQPMHLQDTKWLRTPYLPYGQILNVGELSGSSAFLDSPGHTSWNNHYSQYIGTAGLEAYNVHGGGKDVAGKFAYYFEYDGIGQLEHFDGDKDMLIAYNTNYMPGNDADAISFGYTKSGGTSGSSNIARPESAYVWGDFDAASKLYTIAGADSAKIEEMDNYASRIQQAILEKLWSPQMKMFLARTTRGAQAAASKNGNANPLTDRNMIPARESNLYDVYAQNLIPKEDYKKYVDGFRFLTYGDNHPIFPFYTANQYDRTRYAIGGSNNFSNINFTVQYRGVRSGLRYYDPEHKYVTPEYTAQLLDWMAWSIYPSGDLRVPNQAEYYSNWNANAKTYNRNNPNHIMLGNMNYIFIEDMGGILPRSDDKIELFPIDLGYDYFMVNNLRYHGQDITIVWDKDGSKYNLGTGYMLFINGEKKLTSDKLGHIVYAPISGVVESDDALTVTVHNGNMDFPTAVDTPIEDERVIEYLKKAGLDLTEDAENLAIGATASANYTQVGIRPTPWRDFHTTGRGSNIYNYDPGSIAVNERPVSLSALTDGMTVNEPYWGNYGTASADGWVELDFGREVTFDNVKLFFVSDRQAGGYRQPMKYVIQIPDGEGWKTIPNQFKDPKLPSSKFNEALFEAVTASKMRVAFTNTPTYYTAITEIQVFDSGRDVPPVQNDPPVVTVLVDSNKNGNLSTGLVATVTDDGIPEDGVLTYGWLVKSKPEGASVIFSNVNDVETMVTGTVEGEYEITFWANDGELTTERSVKVTLSKKQISAEFGVSGAITTSGTSSWENHGMVNDPSTPRSSSPGTAQGWGNWGQTQNGTSESKKAWIQYRWDSPILISSTQIYWYDNGDGVQIPRATTWDIQYSNDGTNWTNIDLKAGSSYADALRKNTYNTLNFEAVNAQYLRVNIWGATGNAGGTGILRWRVNGETVESVEQPVIMRVVTGNLPELPEMLNITYSNGQHGKLAFTWEAVSEDMVAETNVEPFSVYGVNTVYGLLAEAQIYVRPEDSIGGITISSFQNIYQHVAVGEEPYLPETVLVSYNDGSRDNQAIKVDWEYDPTMIEQEGIYSIKGNVTIPDYIAPTDSYPMLYLTVGDYVPPQVDKDELKALIEKATELDQALYTEESWENLAQALENAGNVASNPEAIQDDVDAAAELLRNAFDALVEIGEEPEIAVTKIKIEASGLFTLSIKKKAQIPVLIEPNNATDQTVKWISTNPNIFTVDDEGNITPKKQGTATLTAQSSNGLKSTIIVRITA